MKRVLSVLIVVSLCLSLFSGCADKEEGDKKTADETDYTAGQLAAALIASQSRPPEFYYVTENDSVFDAYAALYLGTELAQEVKSGVICYPLGPLASEVTVFEMTSAESAGKAPEPMAGYLLNRAAAFYGYAPEESELAADGQVRVLGSFVVLWILRDADAADAALEAAFSENAPTPPALSDYAAPLRELEEPDDGPTKPEDESTEPTLPAVTTEPTIPPTEPELPAEPDVYDHGKVLAALMGEEDSEALLPKNRAVYDAVTDILAQIITPDMSDYDKELAVNDYIVFHAEYDPAELSSGPIGTPDPDNTNPYGVLIKGVGICLGYTTTFQLFMDALGIECLTVRGYAHGWEEEHAWNLIRLEGDWYAVDVTWNDPVFTGWNPTMAQRLAYAHQYFNVTSQYLRMTEHYWEQDVPEAEGTRFAYR